MPEGGLKLTDWEKKNAAEEQEEAARRKEIASRKDYVEKTNKDLPFPYHIALVDDPGTQRPEPKEDDYVIGVRPEFVDISPDGQLEGEVFSAMPTGMETTVRIRVGNYLLTSVMFGGLIYKIGQKVRLSFSGSNVMLFSRVNGKLITVGTLNVRV